MIYGFLCFSLKERAWDDFFEEHFVFDSNLKGASNILEFPQCNSLKILLQNTWNWNIPLIAFLYWLRNIFLVHHHFFPSFSIFSISFRFVLFLYSDAQLLVRNYEFWIWPDIRHSKLKFSSSLPNFSQSYRPLKFCILSLQKSRQTYYYTFTPPTLFAFIIHHLGTILPRSYNSSVPNFHASILYFLSRTLKWNFYSFTSF